ncbi:hypothetical protein BASA81_009197 [Batrachochytrium salamandrivorans]|nr:hypothetical protein BASA81_009197 [Batrachochytrium salamandrivorans]
MLEDRQPNQQPLHQQSNGSHYNTTNGSNSDTDDALAQLQELLDDVGNNAAATSSTSTAVTTAGDTTGTTAAKTTSTNVTSSIAASAAVNPFLLSGQQFLQPQHYYQLQLQQQRMQHQQQQQQKQKLQQQQQQQQQQMGSQSMQKTALHPDLMLLLNKIPTDKHDYVVKLYHQLRAKQINEEQFISESSALIAASSMMLNPSSSFKGSTDQTTTKRQSDAAASLSKRSKVEVQIPATSTLQQTQAILAQLYPGMASGATPRPPQATPQSSHPAWMKNSATPASTNSASGPTPRRSISTPSAPIVPVKLQIPSASIAKPKPEADVTKMDVEGMMDVTSYAGVDLREEEVAMTDTYGAHTQAVSSTVQQDKPLLNIPVLDKLVKDIAVKTAGISTVDPAFSRLLSHATHAFILNLLHHMRAISQHRSGASFEDFLSAEREIVLSRMTLEVLPTDDVKSQIAVFEERERAEEERMMALLGPFPSELGDAAGEGVDGAYVTAIPLAAGESLASGAQQVSEKTSSTSALSNTPSTLQQENGSGAGADSAATASKPSSGSNSTTHPEGCSSSTPAVGLLPSTSSGSVQAVVTSTAGAQSSHVHPLPGQSSSASLDKPSVQPEKEKRKAKRIAKRDMPEAIKNKNINKTALMAAGGALKSWMLPNAGVPLRSDGANLHVVSVTAGAGGSGGAAGGTNVAEGGGDRAFGRTARVGPGTATVHRASKRIMLKDALFSLEQQPTLRNSALLYKWLSNVK